MLEFLIFIGVAALVASLVWGKKLIPNVGLSQKLPAWTGHIASSAAVVIVAAGIWWLVPWRTTPPGKLLAENMSKEAHEMMVWFLGVGLIIFTSWMVWRIFNPQAKAKASKDSSGGGSLLWILFGLGLIGAMVYGVLQWEGSPAERSEKDLTIDLVKNQVVEMVFHPDEELFVRLPTVNISVHGNKRSWLCKLVQTPLPFPVEFETKNNFTSRSSMKLNEEARKLLQETKTTELSVRFWSELAEKPTCKAPK